MNSVNRILIAFLIAVVGPQIANGQLIDNFSDGELAITATDIAGETISQNGLAPSSTTGGAREVYAGTLASDPPNNALLNINEASQLFSFESGQRFGYFELRYGSEALLELDLLAENSNAIQLDFTSVTPPLFRGQYNVILESPGVRGTSSFSAQLFALPGSGQILLPFDSFGADIDFSSISKITISANRIEAGTLIELESVSAVRVSETLLGDVDRNGEVNFLDISAFITILVAGGYQDEADIDGNDAVNFLDIGPFIDLLNEQ